MNSAVNVPPTIEPGQVILINATLEEMYATSVATGRLLADHFRNKSQVRKLENQVYTATRFSEIKNFIKGQVGKGTDGWLGVASHHLLEELERLDQAADAIAGNKAELYGEIRLRLARGWMQQVSAHYLYEISRRNS